MGSGTALGLQVLVRNKKCPVEGSLITDQMQGLGSNPNQVKQTLSRPADFSSRNTPLKTHFT